MNAEEIRAYCLAKKATTESLPFDEHTLVFKVGGKMFLLLSLDSDPVSFNAKCVPATAIELREKYSTIQPGYHMNKQHWNTVVCDSAGLPRKLAFALIDDSYELIVNSLSKKVRSEYGL